MIKYFVNTQDSLLIFFSFFQSKDCKFIDIMKVYPAIKLLCILLLSCLMVNFVIIIMSIKMKMKWFESNFHGFGSALVRALFSENISIDFVVKTVPNTGPGRHKGAIRRQCEAKRFFRQICYA